MVLRKLGSGAPTPPGGIVYFASKADMKTSTNILKSFLVAWLCLVSMVDLKSLPGFVLCFGEDGHIELEISVDDKCGPETRHAGTAAAFRSEDAEHCGECSDVPLFSQAMQSHFTREVAAPRPDFQPLGILFSAPEYSYSQAQPEEWRIPPAVAAHAALLSLRTVRILV